jgi:hypothetical protein
MESKESKSEREKNLECLLASLLKARTSGNEASFQWIKDNASLMLSTFQHNLEESIRYNKEKRLLNGIAGIHFPEFGESTDLKICRELYNDGVKAHRKLNFIEAITLYKQALKTCHAYERKSDIMNNLHLAEQVIEA